MNTGLRHRYVAAHGGLDFDEEPTVQVGRQVAAAVAHSGSIFDLDEEAKALFKKRKKVRWVGDSRQYLSTLALNSICLVLLSLNLVRLPNGGNRCVNCWLWEDVTVMGVELRMTDKKRMGGSCDFLIQRLTRRIVLGDLKTVSSVKAVDSTESRQRQQLGRICILISKSYPKVCVDKVVTVVAGPGKTKV